MHIEFIRSTERQMPDVPNPDEVTSIMVWHCKFETLACLPQFKNLRSLNIASYPDDSLEPVGELKKLEWLSITHMPKVHDLAPLLQLRNLVSLELATQPSWDSSGKRQVVQTIDPLAQLPRLAHLALLGVIPESKSLASIEACTSLLTARFSGFPVVETKRFYAASKAENAHVPSFPKS